jgi:pyruvate formate lyase activating enzyme
VIFTQGCNFSCPFCHNASLLTERADGYLDPDAVFKSLEARRHRMRAVVVTGGEPTIHNDLPEFLAALRGLDLKIKLDTNGSRPEMLRRIIDRNLIDALAMDVKAPWCKYSELTGVAVDIPAILESVQLIAASGLEHLFRTTFVECLLTTNDLDAIRRALPDGEALVVQTFKPEHALASWLRQPTP